MISVRKGKQLLPNTVYISFIYSSLNLAEALLKGFMLPLLTTPLKTKQKTTNRQAGTSAP